MPPFLFIPKRERAISHAGAASEMANDGDTLDQLLQLQLRMVDQKLTRAKQARALQPTQQSVHVQPPQPWPPMPAAPSVPATHQYALDPGMPWRQQMAAHQHRLDELARRNAELARDCAEAQARPPAAPPYRRPEAAGRQGEPTMTESLLQESLKMQRDLMAHLQRESEASEARRLDAADEDAQAHTYIQMPRHACSRPPALCAAAPLTTLHPRP